MSPQEIDGTLKLRNEVFAQFGGSFTGIKARAID